MEMQIPYNSMETVSVRQTKRVTKIYRSFIVTLHRTLISIQSYIIFGMKIILICWFMVLQISLGQLINFPGVVIPEDTLTQVRRAQKYTEHQLDLYDSQKTTTYTLYLALENYAQILDQLRQVILQGALGYIAGLNNLVLGQGNIVIGSNNKIAGKDNWILTSKEITSKTIESNVLYIGNWRVQLDLVPQIEYRPQLAIEDLNDDDKNILRNMKNLGDFKKLQSQKKQIKNPKTVI